MRKAMMMVICVNIDLDYGDPFFVKKPVALNQSERKMEPFSFNPYTDSFLSNSAKVFYNDRVIGINIGR
jgi:hypothetical protein